MFGFDRPERGSEKRFKDRISLFEKAFKTLPKTRYYIWWLIHNCVSHPLIGILPVRPCFDFHDWTSEKMHPPHPDPRLIWLNETNYKGPYVAIVAERGVVAEAPDLRSLRAIYRERGWKTRDVLIVNLMHR